VIGFYTHICLAIVILVAKLAVIAFVISCGLFSWHEETGSFSRQLIKCVAFLIFLPIILVHKILSTGCKCGECIWCQIANDD
jgi:hypothetical protein